MFDTFLQSKDTLEVRNEIVSAFLVSFCTASLAVQFFPNVSKNLLGRVGLSIVNFPVTEYLYATDDGITLTAPLIIRLH